MGKPASKQSTIFATKTKTGKPVAIAYQPKEVKQWHAQARQQVINQLPGGFIPFSGLIKITKLVFVFPWRKADSQKKRQTFQYKNTKPDMENLEKALNDVLSGVVFIDDAQIVHKNNIVKCYGDVPVTLVELEEMK